MLERTRKLGRLIRSTIRFVWKAGVFVAQHKETRRWVQNHMQRRTKTIDVTAKTKDSKTV